MKQLIPFKKDIIFKTKISEITSISLEHSLELDEDMISGDFIVSGDYKMTEASLNKENFFYKLPFDIALDSRYDTSNIKIEIDDFYYEIINDDVLRVNIEVSLDGLEDIPFKDDNLEVIDFNERDNSIDDISDTIERLKRELDEKTSNLSNMEKLMNEKDEEHKETLSRLDEMENNLQTVVTNMNQNISNDIPIKIAQENNVDTKEIKSLFSNMSEEETFSTYHVYIMREDDTIESVITKYNISKDILLQYNDLENVKLGDKVIIPAILNDK
ncbi:MAG: hypothetical protein E7166_01985 [Firmicutes bacterium]|nr:hypothetical protein [Bacillota bacterium]